MEAKRCREENIKNNLKLFFNICHNLETNYEETKNNLIGHTNRMPSDKNLTTYLNKLMRISTRTRSNKTFQKRTMNPNTQQPLPQQENLVDVNITDQTEEKEKITFRDLEHLPSIIEELEQKFINTVKIPVNSHSVQNSIDLTKNNQSTKEKIDNNQIQESIPVDATKGTQDKLRKKYLEHTNSSRDQHYNENISFEKECEEGYSYTSINERCNVSSTDKRTYNKPSKYIDRNEKKKKVQFNEFEKGRRAKHSTISDRVQADNNINKEKECRKLDQYLRTFLVDSDKSYSFVERDTPLKLDEAEVFKWLNNKKIAQITLGRGLLTCTLQFGYYLEILCNLVKAQKGKIDRWRQRCKQLNIPCGTIRKYRAMGKIANKFKKIHQLNMSFNVLYKHINIVQMLTFEDIALFGC